MASSLGLALYLIAAARTAEGAEAVLPEPPAAGAVWLHAPAPGAPLAGLAALARRLEAARPGLGMILTHPPGHPPPAGALPEGALVLPALPEHPALLHRAMALWQPGAVVLGDGPLPPGLIHAAEEAGRHAFLVDAAAPRVDPRWSALPGLQRTLLRRLRRILVRDATAGRAMRRAGARPWRLEEAGPLALSSGPLPHNAAERDALAGRIAARPVWLAVAVPEAEEATVLAAQALAQRLAHRLLLILVPADPARGPALAAAAGEAGLRAARRGADEEPGDEDQVYIADTEGELGLWYRLAPVSFMGGTLSGAGGRDPFEAAALGSALVHGPATGGEAERYARLACAQASWWIRGADEAPAALPARAAPPRGLWRRSAPPAVAPAEPAAAALAEALVALLAPDRVAAMARAGWNVATEGAEVTDHVAALILEALDEAAAESGAGAGAETAE